MNAEVIILKKIIKRLENRLISTALENEELIRDNTSLICENIKLRSTVRYFENREDSRDAGVNTDSDNSVIILSDKVSMKKI